MLTITINNNLEGVWTDLKLRGQVIKVKVRPRTSEKVREIREKHCTRKMALSSLNNRMEEVDVFDERKIREEVVDWIMEDVQGVEFKSQDGKTLPLDTKARQAILNTDDGSFFLDLLDAANKLAIAVTEKQEEEAKNSDASLA